MSDWIKVEYPTPNKPEILRLARLLNVTKDDAFGKAMRFWLWLDGISVDGRVDGVAPTDVDAVVDTPGFAKCLTSVGWLEMDEENEMIQVPNFERHNGESAKKRANKTRRQADWRRKRGSDVGASVGASVSTSAPTREEKIREDKRREDKKREEQKKKSARAVRIRKAYSATFEAFWNAYPPGRRKSKGKAWAAWQAAFASLPTDAFAGVGIERHLIRRATDYAASDEGRGAYVKMPATWLNQRCWDDAPEAWAAKDDSSGKPKIDIKQVLEAQRAKQAREEAGQ